VPTAIAWDSPVQYLKGVGPVRAQALSRLGIVTVADLLRHYPRTHLDRSRVTPIRDLRSGAEATVLGRVLTSGERRSRQGRTVQTVAVADAGGTLFCQWFGQPYLLRQLRPGLEILLGGRAQIYNHRMQMVHPDYELLEDGGATLHTGRLVPIYPLTTGVGQHWLRRLVHETLAAVRDRLEETLPDAILAAHGLTGLREALCGIHFPQDGADLEAARVRLVYEEIFLIQLAMACRRRDFGERPGLQLGPPGDLTARLVAQLPFTLTRAQRRVAAEILRDLRSGRVMHRLLQGDVGSGKTLVALLGALFVIEQRHQALLMAPTEVLAHQHGEVCRRLCEPLGVSTATLTGSTPAKERREILRAAGAGEIDLLVGTQALVQDGVDLPALGLAIVDEQHRFGVRQRGRAGRTGDEIAPHVLVMSATPIPRSLALTLYGDLDLSILDEMPSGRRPVATGTVAAADLDACYAGIRDRLRAGERAFVIYPVIEETAGQDLRSAEAEYERLAAGPFRDHRVGLLHGRMKSRDKQAVMAAFASGELEVLVATSVVEVGIDVPQATAMVIHHPERFGLAQLHQLRGRIGRAGLASRCDLVLDRWLAPDAAERLQVFCSTQDGFRLAEEDLRRRGPGDVLGVRQHGAPVFLLANPLRDQAVVALAAADAAGLLSVDPRLEGPGLGPLREVLAAGFGRYLALTAAG
jgi:ATP-dependent DNA helicase RecG